MNIPGGRYQFSKAADVEAIDLSVAVADGIR